MGQWHYIKFDRYHELHRPIFTSDKWVYSLRSIYFTHRRRKLLGRVGRSPPAV